MIGKERDCIRKAHESSCGGSAEAKSADAIPGIEIRAVTKPTPEGAVCSICKRPITDDECIVAQAVLPDGEPVDGARMCVGCRDCCEKPPPTMSVRTLGRTRS